MNESQSLTPPQIIALLSRQEPGAPFPVDAVRAAMAAREELTPLLLEALEKAAADVPAIGANDILHIYAIYLLAQFREERVYPILVKFFSWPGDVLDDAVGDLITEDLARILASVCGENIAPIHGLIENESADEYVRAAAIESLAVLVACGRLSRSHVVEYYRSLFTGKLALGDSFVWTGLILSCLDLHPGELMEEIRGAYAKGLVDAEMVPLEDVEVEARLDAEVAMGRFREEISLIENTEEEMSWWACFQPGGGEDEDGEEEAPGVPAKVASTPGRNDPCPCGSQKKFKKCCGAAA